MSGAPSFTTSTIRSPTQTNHFVPYSPTNKSRTYFNHEQYSAPPQTPPPFTPATLARSPHFGSHPTMPSPPTAINGHGPHPSEAGQLYQSNPASSPYQLQRTYSGQLIPAHNPPVVGAPSSHAHPSSRQGSVIQSPIRDHHKDLNGSVQGFAVHDSSMHLNRPRSEEVLIPLLESC